MQNPAHSTSQLRRQFLQTCGLGLGSLALTDLLGRTARAATSPMAPRQPHFPAKVKNVIYLFMAGGPSQLELFSDKPELKKFSGQAPPESFTKGRRFAFLKPDAKLLGSKRNFAKYGQCGMELSWLARSFPSRGARGRRAHARRGVSTAGSGRGRGSPRGTPPARAGRRASRRRAGAGRRE